MKKRHENESLQHAIFTASPDGIAIMDLNGRIRMVSDKVLVMFGLECEAEAIGKTLFDFILSEDHEKARTNIGLMFQGIYTGPAEYQGIRVDGSSINIEVNADFIRDSSGEPAGLVIIARDIGERKKAEDRLRESEARIRAITSASKDAILTMESGGLITFWNPAATKVFGYTEEEVLGKDLHQLLAPARYHEANKKGMEIFRHTGGGNAIGTTQEVEVCHKDGHEIPAELSLSAIQLQDGWHAIGIIRDITDRKKTEAALEESNRKLEAISITDALTGIANRRRFDEVMNQEYSRHIRSGAQLSLILLDIDHFKEFNDTYGHVQGDECLRRIARIIDDCVPRPADLVARYGGEEFACILPETDIYGAVSLAEKIRINVMNRANIRDGATASEPITVSLGVVTEQCRADGSVVDVISRADERLYRAKSLGRNRVEFVSVKDAERIEAGTGKESLVKLTWNDAFCCGNPVIDAQHRALFHKANELFDAIFADASKKDVFLIIEQLLAEVSQHFHDEQVIMEADAFPSVGQHILEHNQLLSQGGKMYQQFKRSTISVGELCHFIFYDIVLLHMLGADRIYFQFRCDANIRLGM